MLNDLDILRFQEIAGTLDSALMLGSLVPVHNPNSEQMESPELTLKQSVSLLACLRTCWSEDVLVISCSDKFLKLSLQLVSRFVNIQSYESKYPFMASIC